MDRVGAASGNDLRFTMFEYQDRRFSGNARDLAVDECIGDEIAEHNNALSFEVVNQFMEVLHEGSPLMMVCTAVRRLSETNDGCISSSFRFSNSILPSPV